MGVLKTTIDGRKVKQGNVCHFIAQFNALIFVSFWLIIILRYFGNTEFFRISSSWINVRSSYLRNDNTYLAEN